MLHPQVGSLDGKSPLCSSGKMNLQGVLCCWARVPAGPISKFKAPKCVCVCACERTCIYSDGKILQDFVHEPFVDQAWGCPVHSKNGISNGVVWFSEADFFCKGNLCGPAGDWIHGPVVQEWQTLTAVNLASLLKAPTSGLPCWLSG